MNDYEPDFDNAYQKHKKLMDFAETLFAAVCNACENDGINDCETCDYYIQACKLGITEYDDGQNNSDFHFLLRP